ncbi:polyprenyl diphosphate synthase [Methanobacterium sp.]|uniref:polyprenyl diphosphate synthase n=1 Tax=Methanobacterium sp. TaxID=2164 RepID=UPI002AB91CC3|nr:polyprenyl diphosphate synthase [Methanobacterium sp.]MDY9924338.1 polyprenyl diphosphate synthase [Methanobacterium sp.]
MSILKPLYSAYEWYISRDLRPEDMPKHVAITMDGNRRYARIQRNMSPLDGHKHGKNTLEDFLGWCVDLGIEIITVYAFSSKNFNRPQDEVQGLMKLFKENFEGIAKNKKIHKNEVRVKAVGQLDLLPDDVREAIDIAEASTASYSNMLLNIAIGYDGRLEIVDTIKKISGKVKEGKLDPEDIDEGIVNENLYTAGLDDPNLIIRTSGEERFSGFLLWQASYSELYFCDSYWPAFRKVDFLRALRSYQQRERRFGV